MRSSVKPWICLLTILMLCSVPAWASGSEPEKKAEGEKKQNPAPPVPMPEPSARVKAKMGQAPAPEACPPADKPKISAIVNTFEDVYGHSGSLETLPEGAELAAAAQPATPVAWREVDKPAAQAERQKEAEPRDDDKKKEANKSGDQG